MDADGYRSTGAGGPYQLSLPHPLSRRGFLGGLAATGTLAALSACGSGGSGGGGGGGGGGGSGGAGGGGTLNALLMKQAGYSVDNIQAMDAAFTKANPDDKVSPTYVAYEALHDKIVAAAPAGTYQVVLIDVIWPAELGSKKMVQDVTDRFPSSWQGKIFPGALDTARYNGRYFGVPWILDTKYLYFNKKMLADAGASPGNLRTWDGLLGAAKKIKKAGIVEHPIVWSWAQAEAVVCDYATLLGAFGGRFLDDSGQPAFQTGGGVQALQFMYQSLQDGLSAPSSTQSLEDDVLKVFSAGQAAIAENWTYMFSNANDKSKSHVAGDCVVAHTPAGPTGKSPGVNGSMALSIAAGAEDPDLAWSYIEYITSADVQNKYAQYSLPIWKASYDDPQVQHTAPDVVKVAKTQLTDMILRPQVVPYNAASQQLQVAIQNALLGKQSVKQALSGAADQWRDLLGG